MVLAVGDFPAPIGFDALEQYSGQIRTALTHFIKNGHGADQTRQPSILGRMQAQQANHITGIGVIVLPFPSLVDANIGVLARNPQVFHVTEKVSVPVLRAQVPQMQAESQKGDCRQTSAPSFDRQTAQQDKTAAFQDFVKEAGQALLQRRQWEIVRTNGLPINFHLRQLSAREFYLYKLVRCQGLDPLGQLACFRRHGPLWAK
jgi:hypothetical protein